jgi:hypothetical protein
VSTNWSGVTEFGKVVQVNLEIVVSVRRRTAVAQATLIGEFARLRETRPSCDEGYREQEHQFLHGFAAPDSF